MGDAPPVSDHRRRAEELLQSIVQHQPTRYARYGYEFSLDEDPVTLGTDDFTTLPMDLAERAGIDLGRYGLLLNPDNGTPATVGIAFRTVFEVEGHYVECPGAYTLQKVPRDFLLAVASAIVGIATAEVAHMRPEIAGAIGGLGGLLINILASRMTAAEPPRLHWLEELILKVVEQYPDITYGELKRVTKLHKRLLDPMLRGLVDTGLVEADRDGKTKTRVTYRLK